MQFRGLLTGAVLLALLSAGVWYSNKLEKEKEGKPAPDAPPKIVEIGRDDIAQVEIARAGGETTVLKRAGSGWELTAPMAVRVDQDAANSVADALKSFSSERLVEEKNSDWAAFGLAAPPVTVTVTKKDGKKMKLLLGDETPASGGFFARLDGDSRLFTVSSFNKSSLDKSLKDLQDRRVVPFDSDKLTRVELGAGANVVELGKNNKGEWQIVKPKPMRADGANVDDLVRRLKDVKLDVTASETERKRLEGEFAKAAPATIARLTDASGTHVFEVRKNKEGKYFGKGSGIDGYLDVAADLGDAVTKPASHYRQKKLFEFGWTDPSRVEIKEAGGATRLFTKDGSKWKEGKAEMDSISVQALIDKLRDLSAADFVDSGASAPILEASVTAGEGGKTEKVLISKTGEKYFALRDNEPTVYEISKTAFEDIQKAAKDVKPPSPTAPPAGAKK